MARVRRPSSSGFGLGLAFVAAVIRSHDGTVKAENRSGGGARVVVELPALVLEHAATA